MWFSASSPLLLLRLGLSSQRYREVKGFVGRDWPNQSQPFVSSLLLGNLAPDQDITEKEWSHACTFLPHCACIGQRDEVFVNSELIKLLLAQKMFIL